MTTCHMRAVLWLAGLLLLLPPQGSGKNIGLFIGISRYRDVRGEKTLQFAGADAEGFGKDWGWNFDQAEDVKVLTNESATAAAVRDALQNALMVRPRAEDTVYVFISARGIASPWHGPDGYLLGFNSVLDGARDSALSVTKLGEMIVQSRARQIFLFADVCRDPTELNVANLINYKLDLLKKLKTRVPFSFILASRPEQLSREDPVWRHGVFNHFLVEALANKKADTDRNGAVSLQELFDYLKKNIRGQEPWGLGTVKPQDTVQPLASRWNRLPQLLAALGGPMEGLLRESEPDQVGGSELATALDLENAAEETLLRYGAGDQFPEDVRPDADEFGKASGLFGRALNIRSAIPVQDPAYDAGVIASLHARYHLCKAQQLLLDKKYPDALTELDVVPKENWIAASYNVAGIAYLEQLKPDYDAAAAAFQNAIKLSPGWAYARHNLALTYAETGDARAAEQEYREAIRRTPYHPYLHYNLGVLMQRVNRKRDAERAYQDTLAWFTRQVRKHRMRSLEWADAGVYDEAARAAAAADVLAKNRAQALNALGALRQAAHRLRPAADYYKASLESNPNLNAARYNLGALYVEMGNLDEGVKLLKESLQADTGLTPARAKLGEAYRMKADGADSDDAAIAELEQAAKQYSGLPDTPAYQAGLAETQADIERLRKHARAACAEYHRAEKVATDAKVLKRLRGRIDSVCKGEAAPH